MIVITFHYYHYDLQKQIITLLKDDHPERPTITLDWSLEHARGILENDVLLFDFMVSRSRWHRDRGVFICSQLFCTDFPQRVYEEHFYF